MKIAITGKGGVGKTTLSALLSHIYSKEGKRVIKLLEEGEQFTLASYRKHCKSGYSSDSIKHHLGWGFTLFKAKLGLNKSTSGVPKGVHAGGGYKRAGIYCPACKQQIRKDFCVPGYRPECDTCASKVKGNAVSIDNLSPEEDNAANVWGGLGGHHMNGQ